MSAIGTRVGPFEIVEDATVPDDGVWYLGRRAAGASNKDEEAFIRVLPSDAPDENRHMLQRAFEVLRSLDDPRIPSPIAHYEGHGALAVTAAQGVPLTALVAARARDRVPMTPATLMDLALELSDVLEHAHRKGHAHGRLAPDRVSLGEDGQIWVWGFGTEGADDDPAFTPPERARGDGGNTQTDQWSLAALLLSLITGRGPWTQAGQALQGDPEPALAPVHQQWPALAGLLERMLDPHPEHRFPSIHALRKELLVLSRRAKGSSSRRELGVVFARNPDNPVPLATPMGAEPREDAIAPKTPQAQDDNAPPAMVELELADEDTDDPFGGEAGTRPTMIPPDDDPDALEPAVAKRVQTQATSVPVDEPAQAQSSALAAVAIDADEPKPAEPPPSEAFPIEKVAPVMAAVAAGGLLLSILWMVFT